MKKIAFVGCYDKMDMIIYIAKTIANLNKKVLVIDASVAQKARYILPTMKAQKQYITTYENIDVAIGFETLKQILLYRKEVEGIDTFEYDYVLIDIDSYRSYYYFGVKPEDKHYFVTSFDVYNLKRGLQIFNKIEQPVKVTKVEFTFKMLKEEDDYLEFLSRGLKIKWDENILFFPYDTKDLDALFVNQRSGRIQMKDMSLQYVDGISFMVEEITGESQGNVKKAIKAIG